MLALVAGQDVEPVEGSDGTDGHWRIAQKVAPDRVISTVDPDARHAHKTVHRRQDGFKAHLAIEPDTGIITDCTLTKAGGSDNHEAVIGLALLDDEPSPVRVLGDSAYGTGATRAALAEAKHTAIIKPIPLRAPIPGGFTTDDFTIDFEARTVTCPANHTLPIPPSGGVGFKTRCRSCPLASQCTTAVTGRKLTLSEYEPLQRAARSQARDPNGKPSTANTGPWSNGPSPGLPATTAKSATAASPATTTGCITAAPRSTYVDSSPWA
ncbi:hypothetical protein MAGR_44060 [Mycolicibacterium agri]|uniref:Transposase IS4-like domain-containing protein n=1 Tax=Mycolicibacterium agri TaxID=36811 RepID=A0A7I9W5J7_MYCAG|nr:hypothetical protein MAGR_44060 [Mycolicibacterium agri]